MELLLAPQCGLLDQAALKFYAVTVCPTAGKGPKLQPEVCIDF